MNKEHSPEIQLEDLAIFGGLSAFREPLHVGRPNIGNREQLFNRFNDMLDRRWLSNHGPYVRQLEEKVADLLGVKHCITVCNATVGLNILARALELTGEVIVPSFTFVATAHALQWQQIKPLFADVDPHTHNLDPASVEKVITPRTSAILGVHVWGRPCAIDPLQAIADKYNLHLIFDAAHAFGCSHQGQMIGGFGTAEVFSFHATKFFNTFEGGAITTNDDVLAEKIRLMTNFGFAGYDNVIYLGTNGKMSEPAAAMGLTGLESLTEFIEVNGTNYQAYQQQFADIPGVRLIEYNQAEQNNYQYVVAEIDEELFGVSRERLSEILHYENVLVRRYFYPGCHQMEPYRTYDPGAGKRLPITEALSKKCLSFPTGTAVSPNHIETVCQIIRFTTQHASEINQRLNQRENSYGEATRKN